MRSLITATLTLLLFVGCWQVFISYADSETGEMTEIIDSRVTPALAEENWQDAEAAFSAAEDRWKKYMGRAHYFLDNNEINETDRAFARTKMYIKTEDISNSSGELLALRRQLDNLFENEKTTLQNIL